MRRRLNPETGRAEVLVDTPVGPQWQAAYNAPRPPEASHWSAGYSPTGRQAGVPASYRTPTSQEEDLFGAEFGSVLGEALKGKQGLVGGGGGQGGGTRQYDIASMTAGMSKYPSLYLRKQRYP
jgi:hypothetical protein